MLGYDKAIAEAEPCRSLSCAWNTQVEGIYLIRLICAKQVHTRRENSVSMAQLAEFVSEQWHIYALTDTFSEGFRVVDYEVDLPGGVDNESQWNSGLSQELSLDL